MGHLFLPCLRENKLEMDGVGIKLYQTMTITFGFEVYDFSAC